MIYSKQTNNTHYNYVKEKKNSNELKLKFITHFYVTLLP